MSNDFRKCGKLSYMPLYREPKKVQVPVVFRRTKQNSNKKKSSIAEIIKSIILFIGFIVLLGIVGRSETDPEFPDKLLILWSVYDIAGCMLAIILVNILKEVFKK